MPGPGSPAGGHTKESAIAEAEYWRNRCAESTDVKELKQRVADLTEALRAGYHMRQTQKTYFANRCQGNLVASKVAESKFDALTEPMFGPQKGLAL